jgi:hypothetical protein
MAYSGPGDALGYDYYVGLYNGNSITEDEWPRYEQRARALLERYRRIYHVTAPDGVDPFDAESMAVCAMADADHDADLVINGEAGGVQSASIGSVSVTYGGTTAQAVDVSPAGRARASYRAALMYLDIYRGVG